MEATRTLAEMRAMVRVLRNEAPVDYAPQPGVADLERLSGASPAGPRVEVTVSGDLAALPAAIDAAVFRIAQEAVTNARRHARNATLIHVSVSGDETSVSLDVRDDGDPGPTDLAPDAGFGLTGMVERALLLGGACRAGPCPGRGWEVSATLPRQVLGVSIRVLVADDQDLVRTGLRLILGTLDGIEVVGEARDGQEAVRLARELRPDVCLMDIRMPVLDGVEATRLLAGPGVEDPIAVVVITTFDLDEYVHGALAAGATGFLLKDAGPELLGEAIRAATRGDSLISPSITRRLLSTFAGTGRAAPPAQPIDPLTEREEQVLLTIARGRTNAEIAAELHISLSTVKTHIGSLMAKLGARNRVEVAMWGYETGRIRE